MAKRGKIDLDNSDEPVDKHPANGHPSPRGGSVREEKKRRRAGSSSASESMNPDPSANPSAGPQEQGGATHYDPPPRRPKSERDTAFDFGAWLLDGLTGIAEEIQHNDLGLPEDFWIHAYAARKETLLALRALVDTAIERCDREESASARPKPSRRRGSINIE